MDKLLGSITRTSEFLRILYLFGKSDIPAAAIPSIIGVEEDRLAKPHRPLPSGGISPENATVLYYVLFALMWAAALYAETIPCTLAYSAAIVIYNEGGLAAIPVVKNVLGAIGLSCYCWGTTTILDHGKELHGLKALAVFMTGAIFATTGHAQDFRDRSADAMMGRKTIPLLLSQPLARWSLAVLIAAWTIGLIALWQPPVAAGIAFAALGLRCVGGYLWSYDEKDDYVSYCWYGVSEVPVSPCLLGVPGLLTVGVEQFWLLGSNLLPIFPRLRGEMD
ncbi:MAG: hypothetical protein LQ343_003761 [Gyalolechia ehrenbergii]|nr:MAG: hypothetical protein LQ343_003761 [Gyalolechia ehrenbergii]